MSSKKDFTDAPTAYLIEPAEVHSKTGKIKGKSIRTYEVLVGIEHCKSWNGNKYTKTAIEPTGKIFTLKNGIITEGKTKATLSEKYLGWEDAPIKDAVDGHSGWTSSLYTTPEAAILAKLVKLDRDAKNIKKEYTSILNTIADNMSSYTRALDTLIEDHPELLI